MLASLKLLFINGGWVLLVLTNGFFLFRLSTPFVQLKDGLRWKIFLVLLYGGSSGMVIWVGDNNLLFTLPVFLGVFWFCTQGDRLGRLTVCVIFFCLIMSVCAILDTYLRLFDSYDIITRLGRPVVFGSMYLLLRSKLPKESVHLPQRLWKLVLGLAALPLCAMAAVVLLTYQKHDYLAVNSLAMNQGLVILPFVLLTSLVLLLAILTLSNHAQLERAAQLAEMRELYYQGLQREQTQVKTLRHDLRNHLTALQGLLEKEDAKQALGYLEQMADSPALTGSRRFCDNETVNVVLASKAEQAQQLGLTADFQISLPQNLPIADPDLCALLGNALDNAIEAARNAENQTILVQCRADKGLFMLKVENTLTGKEKTDLSTIKKDRSAHGFGLAGMREITRQYGGSMEARPVSGRFELIICLPL